MRPLSQLNKYRTRDKEHLLKLNRNGEFDDHFGFFEIKLRTHRKPIRVVASRFREDEPESAGNPKWNHVSVSYPNRTPTWEEMSKIKDMFFEPHEVAMQLHVAESDHVSNHAYCLHIWQPVDQEIPLPPKIMVGDQSYGENIDQNPNKVAALETMMIDVVNKNSYRLYEPINAGN